MPFPRGRRRGHRCSPIPLQGKCSKRRFPLYTLLRSTIAKAVSACTPLRSTGATASGLRSLRSRSACCDFRCVCDIFPPPRANVLWHSLTLRPRIHRPAHAQSIHQEEPRSRCPWLALALPPLAPTVGFQSDRLYPLSHPRKRLAPRRLHILGEAPVPAPTTTPRACQNARSRPPCIVHPVGAPPRSAASPRQQTPAAVTAPPARTSAVKFGSHIGPID